VSTEIEQAKQIAALTAKVEAKDMEIRDLKQALYSTNRSLSRLAREVEAFRREVQPMLALAQRLESLLIEADRQDGMRRLAKQLIGWGALGAFAAALVGIYRHFMGGHP
jgi:predicted RNase H-like nuclease (RuvC/YqgF family)